MYDFKIVDSATLGGIKKDARYLSDTIKQKEELILS